MNEITLRPYQWEATRHATRRLLDGAPSVAVIAPTGAGKSTIITSILHKMPTLDAVMVAAPQQAIENGFANIDPHTGKDADPQTILIPAPKMDAPKGTRDFAVRTLGVGTRFVSLRSERDKESLVTDLLEGVSSDRTWGLTTHQQLCAWYRDDGFSFPADLRNRLLVLDESHHAGYSDDDRTVTKLGELAALWRERGGQVLYVTATPYRADGESVLPEGTEPFTWSIADHAGSGFAPSNFSLGTVSTGVEVATPTEYSGDDLPPGEEGSGSGFRTMISQWITDGRPKAVFIVPAKGSRDWASRLEAALVEAGARVCNAVGTDTAIKDRFLGALSVEKAAKNHADSKTDVFIACKRFDEGTDWPLCSHVYNWGVPSSFGLIIQRWGRAFRSKDRYADYPDQFRQEGRLTFFVPVIKAGAEDRFERKHHEHAWLLGTYLADWETGREYRNSLRIRFERYRPNPVVDDSGEVNDDAGIDFDQNLTLPDHVRTEATALMAQVELVLAGEDGSPVTVQQIRDHIEALNPEPEIMAAVVQILAEKTAIPDGVEVGAGLPANPARADLTEAFREIIAAYGDQTISIADGVLGYTTQFTGGDVRDVAARLKGMLPKPDFTVESLEQACRAFHAEHGTHPHVNSGDCSPYFGWKVGTETWMNVNASIRNGSRGLGSLEGSSLSRFCIDIGLVLVKPDFTVESVGQACRAYHTEHGTHPKQSSGDASPYFGWPEGTETWSNVDQCIRLGIRVLGSLEGSSLRQFCIDLGLVEVKSGFTVGSVKQACRAFHAENGTHPNVNSGDASPYFGWKEGTETWNNVDNCIRLGGRGLVSLEGSTLYQFCIDLGLVGMTPDFTVESVDQACRKFHEENGTHPKQSSGDASPYFGWSEGTETWVNVNACFRNGSRGLESLRGSTLVQFCTDLGLVGMTPDFTPDSVEQACRKFYAENGTHPGSTRGDCSKYFGWPEGTETWNNVSACIRNMRRGLGSLGGVTLYQFCADLGLVFVKPDFTPESVGQACRAYHAEHGTHPKQSSGDCSRYFDWEEGTETWLNVNACIQDGRRGLESLKGSTLSKMCKVWGVATARPDFTPDSVEQACRAYHTEHGAPPRRSSGDCSPYFDWEEGTETWSNVDASIKRGNRGLESLKGSSLFKMCKVWGLKK